MNEMIAEAYRLWPRMGTIALLAEFKAIEETNVQGRPYLCIMADMSGVGRKESMTARVHRTIFPEHSDKLEAEMHELYKDLEAAIRRSSSLGPKF